MIILRRTPVQSAAALDGLAVQPDSDQLNRHVYRPAVGGWMVYVTIAPTAADTRTGWAVNDIGGDPSGQ